MIAWANSSGLVDKKTMIGQIINNNPYHQRKRWIEKEEGLYSKKVKCIYVI
jgi:hypothetical protein